jgi:hypothetical protein
MRHNVIVMKKTRRSRSFMSFSAGVRSKAWSSPRMDSPPASLTLVRCSAASTNGAPTEGWHSARLPRNKTHAAHPLHDPETTLRNSTSSPPCPSFSTCPPYPSCPLCPSWIPTIVPKWPIIPIEIALLLPIRCSGRGITSPSSERNNQRPEIGNMKSC